MRARTILAVVAAMAAASIAQAEAPGLPAFGDPMPADAAIHDLDVMFVHLQPVVADGPTVRGEGEVLHSIWYNKEGIRMQAFRTVVEIGVPSEVPGLDTLIGVLSADVSIEFNAGGVPYAQCYLPVQLISSRSNAIFELYLEGRGVGVKPHKGICDVDLQTPGIQIGIPLMHAQDLVETIVQVDDVDPGRIIMEGYCY